MLSIEELKTKLEPLFENPDLQIVLVFGSVASGKTHPHSDIDLGFLYKDTVDPVRLTSSVMRYLQIGNVDVVDLRRASPLLKYAAVKNGTILYEKEHGMFAQFYSLALRMYMDSKKLRVARETYINNFIKSRGRT